MKLIEAIHKFSEWKLLQVVPRTTMGYDFELRMFCLFLRNPDTETLRLNDVLDYLSGLKQLGWKQNSFIHKCSYLRKFFRFLRLQGYCMINEDLIPIPKPEFKPPRVATEKDYRALLDVIRSGKGVGGFRHFGPQQGEPRDGLLRPNRTGRFSAATFGRIRGVVTRCYKKRGNRLTPCCKRRSW